MLSKWFWSNASWCHRSSTCWLYGVPNTSDPKPDDSHIPPVPKHMAPNRGFDDDADHLTP